jgi:23S rRNA pseudouridine1911/1915/1917 synthase
VSIRNIDITEEEAGERIDTFLAGKTGITRSQIQKRIENGDVLVNSKPVSQNYRIRSNDSISVTEIAEKDEGLIPEDIPVNTAESLHLQEGRCGRVLCTGLIKIHRG